MTQKRKNTIRDITLIAIWAALTFAVKLVLAPIANVELVSLLLTVFTVVMGLERGICAALVFTTLTVFESAYYGAGDWIVTHYTISRRKKARNTYFHGNAIDGLKFILYN